MSIRTRDGNLVSDMEMIMIPLHGLAIPSSINS